MSLTRPTRALLAAAIAPLALAGAVTAATPAAASAPGPALLSCTGKRLERPTGTVILACADANVELQSSHWSSWTAAAATGTTDFGLNLCNPDCAASRISFFPHSAVRLSKPVSTRHGLLFSRVTVHYTLHGKAETYTDYPAT